MKNNQMGLIILVCVVAIGLFGGSKSTPQNTLISNQNLSHDQKQIAIQKQIDDAQIRVTELKEQIQTAEDKKLQSQYNGIVSLRYVNRSTNPSLEYISIYVNVNSTTTIPITGWTLKSTSSGETVSVPKGTYLFFTGTTNSEDDIVLTGGDNVYIVTGNSPIGASFKLNKCSGYLAQFQTFTPYISSICPAPRNEDLSAIPKVAINDACFDYIEAFPSCKTQTENLPLNWSYECKHFINDKLNYSFCVNTHKNDKDFYQHDWRVYLKRSVSIWKDRRENIVLYDNLGKIVSTLSY